MTTMDCKTYRSLLPDLLLEPERPRNPAATAHAEACAPCRAEYNELRATFLVLEDWTAPEPSPYFDSRVRAHLREAQQAVPEGLWERLSSTLRFSTGRGLRSALAGAFVMVALLGGGTVATLLTHHGSAPVASPTVNDLKIYDNNAQALRQMDLLDEPGSDAGTVQPQS